MNYSWILPYQESYDIDKKKRLIIFKQNVNLFKLSFLYSFNHICLDIICHYLLLI